MADKYTPLTWPSDSLLSADEQELVESQRRQLWDSGVRKEPMLTRMAYEFAAVLAMGEAARAHADAEIARERGAR